jgi:phosphoribosylamine---glycine ligase
MKILVIGSGGREHAIVSKLSQSRQVDKLYAIPGNAGIAELAECVNISLKDGFTKIAEFVVKNQIDLTVVGPEVPLTEGIVDYFQTKGLAIFGPSKSAAQLEGSKVWSKQFMTRHGLPTANYKIFNNRDEAVQYVSTIKMPTVVKADGLAAGKGVLICKTQNEAIQAIDLIMSERAFGAAGERVIIEDCLIGKEISMLAFTDGTTIVPMVTAQDYKRALDNDQGLNTGGMGSISPSPNVTPELAKKIYDRILVPTIQGLNKDGIQYVGIIYAGLMVVDGEPYLLEYNCRFGDPETQVILFRLKTDLVDIILACLANKLDRINIEWDNQAAVCVVLASGGYPGKYETKHEIIGLNTLNLSDSLFVYHAGTSFKEPKPNIIFSPAKFIYDELDEDELNDKINHASALELEQDSAMTEEEMLKVFAKQLNMPIVDIGTFPIDLELLKLIPIQKAKRYHIFPLELDQDGALLVAVSDPLNVQIVDELRRFTGYEIKRVIATEQNIQDAIKKYYLMNEIEKPIITSGGRVLNIVALGNSIADARNKVYQAINLIEFKDMHYRTDIGQK